MKPKTARRFFNRNRWRIIKEKFEAENPFTLMFGYQHRKKYKVYLKVLREDQQNPASQRVYQRALEVL